MNNKGNDYRVGTNDSFFWNEERRYAMKSYRKPSSWNLFWTLFFPSDEKGRLDLQKMSRFFSAVALIVSLCCYSFQLGRSKELKEQYEELRLRMEKIKHKK